MNNLVNKIMRTSGARLALMILLVGCSHEPKPTALVSAKGALDEFRSAVLREIKDPDKASQVAGLVDQAERVLIEANDDRKAHDARIQSLNADYDATEEDFRAAFREFNAKWNDHQDRILDLNQRAKALTTAKEWKALTKAQKEAVKKAMETVRGM